MKNSALVFCLVLGACSSRGHVASNRRTSVSNTMNRQIAGAADAGEGDAQLRILRAAVLADPTNLGDRLSLANHYWKSGAAELAVDHYRIAADHAPANSSVAILLARALRDCDRAQDAIDSLVKFCDRNANPSPSLLSLLGILQDDAGRFADAERVYRAAVQLDGARADVRNNLGYNLLLQGKPAEAVEQFQQALKADPHSEVAHNNLGLALLAQWKDDSQPKEALLHWQSVSDPASAHNNLAAVLIDQKRYQDARSELEIALGYQKDHPAALKNLKLVAQLDGGSDHFDRPAHNSFWKRVKTVFSTRRKAGKPADGVLAASR